MELSTDLLSALEAHRDKVLLRNQRTGSSATGGDLLARVERARKSLREAGVPGQGSWAALVGPPGEELLAMSLALRLEGVCTAELSDEWPAPLLEEALRYIDAPWVVSVPNGLRRRASTGPGPAAGVTTLAFTGGTDGELKAALLTDAGLAHVAREVVRYLELTSEDVVACGLPWTHGYGRSVLMSSLLAGAELCLLPSTTFVGDELRLLGESSPTHYSGVPVQYRRFLSTGAPLPASLRACCIAGGALVPEELELLAARLGPETRIFPMYGLTEMTTRVSFMPPSLFRAKLGSCGRPIDGVSAQIDRPGSDGVGELLVQGPNAMRGYWRKPEETSKVLLPGGWVRTGDLAKIDPDGCIWIQGRAKDVIRRGGETIYPAALERELSTFPGVREAVVTGRFAPGSDDELWAFVATADGKLDEEGIRRHLLSRLGSKYIPDQVRGLEKLPRSPAGKVIRDALPGLAPRAEVAPAPTDVHGALKKYFQGRYGLSDAELEKDFPLPGLVDSLGMLSLVAHLRDELGIRVPPADLNENHFGTFGKLTAYLKGARR